MNMLTNRTWRLPFIAAGLAMAIGGRLHPEADADRPLSEELATMTAGDTWVLSHSLIAFGTALLVLGLWTAHWNRSWPVTTHRALRVGAAAMSLYLVETVFHLGAVVDADALANGDFAPITLIHLALSILLYPATGFAMVWLAARQIGAVDLPRKIFGVAGVLGGALHAASVPLTMVLPDTELSPVFAGAGLLFSAWAVGTGLTGMPRPATPRHQGPDSAPSQHTLARA
jgi:hypothetical protein